jgi:arylsulfatase A-like enzyme
MAILVKRSLEWLDSLVDFLGGPLGIPVPRDSVRYFAQMFKASKTEAWMVDDLFLDWLSSRRSAGPPARPFFAFLNYADAHAPYRISRKGLYRFGVRPRNAFELDLIRNWSVMNKEQISAQELAFARDAYDSCVAHIDEQVGRLFDRLADQGTLDRTWVIIASDHGESFGEHAGIFCHGTSLYQTELHVPLLIVPPAQGPSPRVVTQRVSLRDIAPTIVDLAGCPARSPFPGKSLSRFWRDSAGSTPAGTDGLDASSERALAEVVPNDLTDPDPAHVLKPRWPLAALAEGEWNYIRREGDVHEELFHARVDAQERHNLADDPSTQPVLQRMRDALRQLTAGPLTPQRFNP